MESGLCLFSSDPTKQEAQNFLFIISSPIPPWSCPCPWFLHSLQDGQVERNTLCSEVTEKMAKALILLFSPKGPCKSFKIITETTGSDP